MPRTRENTAYAQRLIREYNHARKLLHRYLKKRHDPSDVTAMIAAIIENMTAKQSKIIGYTLNKSFKAGAKEGDKILRTITAAAATVGFDMSKVADTHLNKITGDTIGRIGKYNSVTTNQLFGQYQTLLADNKLVNTLNKSGWSQSIEKSLIKRGTSAEVISQLKGQTTTKKIVTLLETQGIRGGMNPREVSRLLQPHVSSYFGPKGVIIDNVGKFKKVLKVDADGNFKYVKQAITRPYRATPKAYSNLLARSSMIQAHHEGRYQSLQKTGLVDHYISKSVLDANTCNLCATMHGQRVSHSEGPLYHPSGACELKPIWKKDSGIPNKDPSFYENQRDQHFWKQHQLAEYNKNMPRGAKLKFHSMLPKDAIATMPGKAAMRTIRYNALGKPVGITPSVVKPKVTKVKSVSEHVKKKVVEKVKEQQKEKVKEKVKEKIEKVVKKKIIKEKKVKKVPKKKILEDIGEEEMPQVVKKALKGKPGITKEKGILITTDKDAIRKRLSPYGVWSSGSSKSKLNFSLAEERATKMYQGDGFTKINGALRGKTKMTDELKKTIKDMDSARSQSRVPEDFKVFRGISPNQAEAIQKTNGCINKGYTSTTFNPDNAFTFATRDKDKFFNLMEFKVKEGTNALMWPGGENEIMLGRGLKLKCTGIKEINNLVMKTDVGKATKAKNVRIFMMEAV